MLLHEARRVSLQLRFHPSEHRECVRQVFRLQGGHVIALGRHRLIAARQLDRDPKVRLEPFHRLAKVRILLDGSTGLPLSALLRNLRGFEFLRESGRGERQRAGECEGVFHGV